ncbi:MAG: hypothetical protein HY427_03405 [Candidatus Levybacteria bacterium]|nr:hypothetical protein [Candidatus Levybacteria bacterium]
MKNFIIKRKVLFFLAVIFVIVPASLFLLSILFPKEPVSIKPAPEITITPFPTDEETRQPITPVHIESVFPEENLKESFFPIQQIELTLSKTIDPANVVVMSEPKVVIKIGFRPNNPTVLIISPDPVWESGITTIRVARLSNGGKILFEKDFVYKINTKFPEAPPLGSPEYDE